jgi:hypothetical protein
MIHGDVFATMRPGAAPEERAIAGGEELLRLLKERFGLVFPSGTIFRPCGVGAAFA